MGLPGLSGGKDGYYLSEVQKAAMAPPSMRGSKFMTVRSMETGGLAVNLMDVHLEVRAGA